MEKGFREVLCPPPCGQKLRLTITKEHYGKKFKVKCPKCHLIFPITIPIPAMRPAGNATDSYDKDPLFDSDDPFGFFKEVDKVFGRKK